MMLANDLKTYYDEVRRYLDCPKDEQDRLLLSVNKQVIELQVDNPNLDYDGIVEFLGEPESLAASLMERLSPDVIQKFRKRKRHLRMSAIVCIAAVSLKAYFTYNGITAGVTGTEYAKSLASGWSYTNHKITTTNVSSSSGGTATLTATLKNFPLNVAVRLSLHCSPNGTITKG